MAHRLMVVNMVPSAMITFLIAVLLCNLIISNWSNTGADWSGLEQKSALAPVHQLVPLKGTQLEQQLERFAYFHRTGADWSKAAPTSTNSVINGISPAGHRAERQGMAYHERDIRSVLPPTPTSIADPRAQKMYLAALQRDELIGARCRQASEYTQSGNVRALNAPQARSREQIIAECQARYDEMAREAAKPERQFPCSTCTHGGGLRCRHPIIIGVERKSVAVWDQTHPLGARLCGPEKALWQPRQSWWARIVEWVMSWLT